MKLFAHRDWSIIRRSTRARHAPGHWDRYRNNGPSRTGVQLLKSLPSDHVSQKLTADPTNQQRLIAEVSTALINGDLSESNRYSIGTRVSLEAVVSGIEGQV